MKIRIGTRGSPLALAQAQEVQAKLASQHGLKRDDLPIVVIKTSGDRIQDRPLSEVGGKGLFTKEIEEALYDRSIDIAVHSMKDLETEMPDGLAIAAVLEREDVRDAFISLKHKSLADLPKGAIVGTSSLRRRAQICHVRPDLRVVEFRGNVQTRLSKLEAGVADATFLACAGLRRLGQADRITAPIETSDMLPAVAQGAIAIQMREHEMLVPDVSPSSLEGSFGRSSESEADGNALWHAVAALDHGPSHACVEAERAFLAELDGSCRTPIAGLAIWHGDSITFRGEILAPDGTKRYTTKCEGSRHDIVEMAKRAGNSLLAQAGEGFFTPTFTSSKGIG